MKRYAFALLWTALIVQACWALLNGVWLHRSPGVDAAGLVITATFAAFAVGHGRRRWLAVVARLLMAAEFLLAVGDRFGAFGPAGNGVYWGDFAHFVAYTRTVTGFAPAGAAPALAVLATIAEVGLGLALLFGTRTRLAALGSAGLLLIYGVSMTVSLPVAEQFHFAVFVLCAGMFALSTVDTTAVSVDGLAARRRITAAAHP
jgi:putative oxidoreductase